MMNEQQLAEYLNAKFTEAINLFDVPPSGGVDIERANRLMSEIISDLTGNQD